MKYKDKSLSGVDVRVYTELVMGMASVGKRQISWILGRYKFLFLAFAFSLCLWTLVRGPQQDNNIVNSPAAFKSEPKKVKEIDDFDYKYETADKNTEYSDNGSNAAAAHNIKQSVQNYIQSHKDKIKSVNNNDIKEALILSNDPEELPSQDFQRDPVRPKNKPTRANRNSLNGVQININDNGKTSVTLYKITHYDPYLDAHDIFSPRHIGCEKYSLHHSTQYFHFSNIL